MPPKKRRRRAIPTTPYQSPAEPTSPASTVVATPAKLDVLYFPHIIDTILEYGIDSDPLAVVMMMGVCKAWRNYFAPRLFRHIEVDGEGFHRYRITATNHDIKVLGHTSTLLPAPLRRLFQYTQLVDVYSSTTDKIVKLFAKNLNPNATLRLIRWPRCYTAGQLDVHELIIDLALATMESVGLKEPIPSYRKGEWPRRVILHGSPGEIGHFLRSMRFWTYMPFLLVIFIRSGPFHEYSYYPNEENGLSHRIYHVRGCRQIIVVSDEDDPAVNNPLWGALKTAYTGRPNYFFMEKDEYWNYVGDEFFGLHTFADID